MATFAIHLHLQNRTECYREFSHLSGLTDFRHFTKKMNAFPEQQEKRSADVAL